jgi:Protein of unknown function (DUF229)
MFIWLPEWFKRKHPEIVQTLKINRNRLSNPYDMHMTLKHIIELSQRIDNLPVAHSCHECQSVFKELPWNRSCADAKIEQHWCTCSQFSPIDKKDKTVKLAVKFVTNSVNSELESKARMPNSTKPLCAHLRLKSIILAKKSPIEHINSTFYQVSYLLMFDVLPSSAKFESTVTQFVQIGGKTRFELAGSISRLNEYSSQSACINIDNLKKYCYCLKRKKRSGWLNFN